MSKIKIAIADDYKIYRDGLKVGLAADDNLEVVLEADNGEDLLKGIPQAKPDVIIMDLKMPIMDGMEATKEVKKKFENIKVLVVTMYEDDKFIIHMMENGANGYLLKNTGSEELRKSIYSVHETGYYFNDLVNKALLKKLILKGNIKPSFNQNIEFSERELEVLKLICEEKNSRRNRQGLIHISRTVEGHRTKLIEKVGVKNTAGLVMFALKNGIVQ